MQNIGVRALVWLMCGLHVRNSAVSTDEGILQRFGKLFVCCPHCNGGDTVTERVAIVPGANRWIIKLLWNILQWESTKEIKLVVDQLVRRISEGKRFSDPALRTKSHGRVSFFFLILLILPLAPKMNKRGSPVIAWCRSWWWVWRGKVRLYGRNIHFPIRTAKSFGYVN